MRDDSEQPRYPLSAVPSKPTASDYMNIEPSPLLAQIPLTVSPFVSLPTATTLPYTYKSLPSTLPPSSTGEQQPTSSAAASGTASGAGAGAGAAGDGGTKPDVQKPRYVHSSTGHAAHPDDIIASCQALQTHLEQTQRDAERTLKEWEESIRERDLAEKRKVAPGWLDSEEKILEPERRGKTAEVGGGDQVEDLMSSGEGMGDGDALGTEGIQPTREGEELDRAFGGMGLKS